MTTSATGRHPRSNPRSGEPPDNSIFKAMKRRAFTLMEMLLVLAIIGMVFAGSYIGISSLNDQQALHEPYENLRSMAKTAWQRSLSEQNSWQIRFYPDRFVLEPKQAVNEDDRRMFMERDREMNRGSGVETVVVAPEILMEVRRWGQPHWFRPEKGMLVAWIFEHSGLCEPISVRFTSEHGTVGAQFDPLTASVKEEIVDRD
jgi:prepilin-type N-terminal cleavage/methylation domain-containing protein